MSINVTINDQTFDALRNEAPVVAARALAQTAFDRAKATAEQAAKAAVDLKTAQEASEVAIDSGVAADALAAEEALEQAQRTARIADKLAAAGEIARVRTNEAIHDAVGEACIPPYILAVKARFQACRDFDAASALMKQAEAGWAAANAWIGHARSQRVPLDGPKHNAPVFDHLKGFEAERALWEQNIAPLPGVDLSSL